MSDGENVPPIDSDEWLARFIHYQRYIRQDRTVRADAFIPYPYPALSVTRHLQLSEAELWRIGRDVARQVNKTLHGRVDAQVFMFQQQQLHVVADPVSRKSESRECDWLACRKSGSEGYRSGNRCCSEQTAGALTNQRVVL